MGEAEQGGVERVVGPSCSSARPSRSSTFFQPGPRDPLAGPAQHLDARFDAYEAAPTGRWRRGWRRSTARCRSRRRGRCPRAGDRADRPPGPGRGPPSRSGGRRFRRDANTAPGRRRDRGSPVPSAASAFRPSPTLPQFRVHERLPWVVLDQFADSLLSETSILCPSMTKRHRGCGPARCGARPTRCPSSGSGPTRCACPTATASASPSGGRGIPLVVGHGFSFAGGLYVQSLSRLASMGFRVLAVDMAGHGGSTGLGAQGWGLTAYRRFLGRVLDELGVERAVLLRPLPRRAPRWPSSPPPNRTGRWPCCSSTPPSARPGTTSPPSPAGIRRSSGSSARRWPPTRSRPCSWPATRASSCRGWPCPRRWPTPSPPGGSWRPALSVLLSARSTMTLARLKAERLPVFVLHGERDQVVPVAAARDAAERAGGELVVVHGAAHSWLLEDPETLRSIVAELLGDGLGTACLAAIADAGLDPADGQPGRHGAGVLRPRRPGAAARAGGSPGGDPPQPGTPLQLVSLASRLISVGHDRRLPVAEQDEVVVGVGHLPHAQVGQQRRGRRRWPRPGGAAAPRAGGLVPPTGGRWGRAGSGAPCGRRRRRAGRGRRPGQPPSTPGTGTAPPRRAGGGPAQVVVDEVGDVVGPGTGRRRRDGPARSPGRRRPTGTSSRSGRGWGRGRRPG